MPDVSPYDLAILGAVLVILAVVGALWRNWWRSNRRERSLRDLLDGVDSLERQLHDCRERMKRLQSLLGQLPSDMTRPAMGALDPDSQVKIALRDVLAHRLWIQQYGANATQGQLDDARKAIQKSSEQLTHQLSRLDDVGRELQEAGEGLRAAYQRSAPRVPTPVRRKANGHAAPDA